MNIRAEDRLRPAQNLSDTEIDELAHAYNKNAVGDLLVGTKGEARLLTLSLPPQHNIETATRLMAVAAARLRACGCDGYAHGRKIKIRSSLRERHALLVEECLNGKFSQRLAYLSDQSRRRLEEREHLLDEVSRALREKFEVR
jgi:hypothetical protein